jgi:hypothetical protein
VVSVEEDQLTHAHTHAHTHTEMPSPVNGEKVYKDVLAATLQSRHFPHHSHHHHHHQQSSTSLY